MSNDLRLNSLERFSKQSSRLVLEEHGHCEVPAGCGGVVLRWHNPSAGVPVVFYGAFAARATIFVDGSVVASSRTILPFGSHVLSLHLTDIAVTPGVFLFATLRDSGDGVRDASRVIPSLCSAADNSWLVTVEQPEEQRWTSLDFDDSGWLPLTQSDSDLADVPQNAQWQYTRVLDMGAAMLALPAGHAQVWIRKRFTIEATP